MLWLQQVIEHDDEELSSPGLSPLSSCAGLHAFSTDVGLSAGLATNALSTRAIEEELERGAQLNTRNLLAAGRAATEQCGGRTMTSSMATTRGSQALLEAAMSSAICHPNIVQVGCCSTH